MGGSEPGQTAAGVPAPERLLAVVRRLDRAGDGVAVVRLMERWTEQGRPPREARLAHVRALMALCLMDRAWVRLRELTSDDPQDAEALRLTAEMFVQRGWPARAQRVVERLQELCPGAPWLTALRAAAEAPPPDPGAVSRDADEGADPAAALRAARHLLAAGKVIRARGVLERLRREGAGGAEVAALLWAVRGDLGGGGSLHDLLVELGAEPGGGAEPTVSGARAADADPDTAEVSKVLSGGRGQGAFPSLFRLGGEGPAAGPDEDDVTMSARMASGDELARPPEPDPDAADGDLYPLPDRGGDTQILQVISRGDGGVTLAPVEGPLHARKGPQDSLQRTLDLRAWQQEMGVGAPEEDADEDAEADLVVMRAAPASAPRASAARDADEGSAVRVDAGVARAEAEKRPRINVIERVPVPPPMPEVPGEDEDTPEIGPSPVPPDDEPLPRRRSGLGLGLGLAAAAGLALLLILGAARWLGGPDPARVADAVHNLDVAAIRGAQAELRGALSGGGRVDPEVASWLVVADLTSWALLDGDPAHLAEARALIAEGAVGQGTPARRAAVALAWAEGRVRDAPRIEAEAPDPTARLMAAELWLAAADAPRAAGLVDGLDGPRAASVRAAAGAAVEPAWAAHPWVVVQGAADRSRPDEAVLAQLAGVRASAPEGARRLRSHAWVAEAARHRAARRNEAERAAWDGAVGEDPYSPVALEGAAARAAADGDLVRAGELLQRCLGALPVAEGCRRGAVQLALAQRDLDAAAALVEGWRAEGEPGLLGSWVDLARRERVARARAAAEASAEAGAIETPGQHPALARFLLHLSAGGAPGAPAAVVDGLRAQPSPWDQLLADQLAAPPAAP